MKDKSKLPGIYLFTGNELFNLSGDGVEAKHWRLATLLGLTHYFIRAALFILFAPSENKVKTFTGFQDVYKTSDPGTGLSKRNSRKSRSSSKTLQPSRLTVVKTTKRTGG